MTDRNIPLSVRIASCLIAVGPLLITATPAFAADITIAVGAPAQVSVGQEVEVKAVLSKDGVPVKGADVALTYQASLAGRGGRVELATATTDETGTAVMVYQQRADDNGEMQIVYLGPETDPVPPYTFTIAVESGGLQLYQSESGLEIPFVNGTLVIVVISGVWFLISLAAIYLVRVGLAGRITAESSTEDGSIWIGVMLAATAVITAIGMVIVFVRAPVSNTDLTDPDVYNRTPIAYIDITYPYVGFGLGDESTAQTGDPIADGSVFYFKYGCAACHGLSGQGAVVGSTLIDEIGSFGRFDEDTREGPKGMPGYDDVTISEERLRKIHAYLKEAG